MLNQRPGLLFCGLFFSLLSLPPVQGAESVLDVKIDIPYKKFVLQNGLTLIVHEDHKAPIVAVNLWYHVGSKNENPGKTGFAHLFEHLMFTGSEHFKGGADQRAFFEVMEQIGATDLNGTAPAGHPYSWTVIGSMEDLNAASLEDVRAWFTTYYGAANAVLVLAGDIDADTAFKKAEQYFGNIQAGPPVARYDTWIPRIPGTRRQSVSDRVPQARLYKVWNLPPYGEADTSFLDLVRSVLASGKTSRLYKRLVYDDQIATDVSVEV